MTLDDPLEGEVIRLQLQRDRRSWSCLLVPFISLFALACENRVRASRPSLYMRRGGATHEYLLTGDSP
eukprot:6442133-Pyramimonas_sp.AAC.1